jgi:CheY-like chemotaxis protein
VKEKIPTLFEPFTQEDTTINRQYGGSGLGLSIAKRLVNAMNGDIIINSEVNVGTEVTLTCMLDKKGHAAESLDPILPEKRVASDGDILSGISILLAEDNEFNQKFMLKLLQRHGAVCSIASNGQEAIEMAEAGSFDLILMDLHMPIVNGIEATKTIVERSDHYLPIIGLTADITESEQTKLLSAGAQSIQLKPVDEERLVNSILESVGVSSQAVSFSGGGMLEAVLPVEDLKRAISQNLDNLEDCLHADEQMQIRPLIHDLLGFCGLYGMTGLRDIVLELKSSYAVLDNSKNLQQVKNIRQYVKESSIFN